MSIHKMTSVTALPDATKPEPDIFAPDLSPLPIDSPLDTESCLDIKTPEQEIEVHDLDEINGWLWIVGVKGNVRPLHHQKVLLREIIPTDLSRLHLVWFDRVVYVKPLPDCLLDYGYVHDKIKEYRTLKPDHYIRSELDSKWEPEYLRQAVSGFLRSYCSMVQSKTDFRVAQDLGLLKKDLDWAAWSAYRRSILDKTGRPDGEDLDVTPRYQFGELRLGRLNIVYRLTFRSKVYFTVHKEYNTYFQQYFSLFIATCAIVATILTAMQVLEGIQSADKLVVGVSYWFGVVAMIAILACLAPVLVLFVVLFLWNVAYAFCLRRCI
ncbi:hypothetical protein BDV97DRAFT_362812 [Delphinella strobiligena]|nr:hypothetical protein BDV97DRAFT_362812 [Delphinella strobiligena]